MNGILDGKKTQTIRLKVNRNMVVITEDRILIWVFLVIRVYLRMKFFFFSGPSSGTRDVRTSLKFVRTGIGG